MGLISGCYIDGQDSDYVLINKNAYRRKVKMNTNETIEYEIPTEEELDVSVQGAERRGIRIGVKKMRDAVAAMWNTMQSLDELDEAAEKLLAEQKKK